MTRRCSHCSHNGHNSRTCSNRGVKLFGVRLIDGSIRKSASMGNLSHYAGSSGGGASPAVDGHEGGGAAPAPAPASAEGYASEDFVQGSSSSSRERKKGIPWTEEEHRMFLLGLKKLGKGDWRGIARNFVVSRTPTQVASHAQKYFIRQTNTSRRKRRSSLFDIVPDQPEEASELSPVNCNRLEQQGEDEDASTVTQAIYHECGSMDSTTSVDAGGAILRPESSLCYPIIFPAHFPPILPLPLALWPGCGEDTAKKGTHELIKPTAAHTKTPINVEELVGMSRLSLGDALRETANTVLSLKLDGRSDRQSAFHANPSPSGGNVNSGKNPIHAVY